MTAVIQCPKCQQKYRVPPQQIGTEVQCSKPTCGNRFVAVDTIPAVAPAPSPAAALPPDVSGSTPLSRDTELRLEGQRLKAQLDQEDVFGPDLWSGHILFWSGAAMLLAAVFIDTSVIARDGSRIHNLAKAGQQLLLALCGLGSFIGGSVFLARDSIGLRILERGLLVCWIVGIGFVFAFKLMN